jgi:hypothetical protein
MFGVTIADRDVAAFFEPMRDGAAIFAVGEPCHDLAGCCGNNLDQGCSVWVSHVVEHVREFCVFGPLVRDDTIDVKGARARDWESDKLHSDPEAIMEVTLVTVPMRRPRASPLAINAAVIGAILLRDIRQRGGAYYTGFLMILLMPLAHILLLVTIYRILGRLAPHGTDQMVYFGISILPFAIYAYSSRQIVISLVENRPLLYFNRVKIFAARLGRDRVRSRRDNLF